jgi:predicted RNA binding protein YcfA (HicA-like mRNA interferase family)
VPKLPRVLGAEVVRRLERLGFRVLRQRGSHIVMRRDAVGCVVRAHQQVKVGTLAGFSGRREFLRKSSSTRSEQPRTASNRPMEPTASRRTEGLKYEL